MRTRLSRRWLRVAILLLLIGGAAAPPAAASDQQFGHRQAPVLATERSAGGQTRSLDSLLAPDGTLPPDLADGSYAVSGLRMETAADGRPRFVREDVRPEALPGGPENWDPRFANGGADSTVLVLAVSGTSIYVGGDFTSIGGIPANRIARFDTTANSWSPLGFGVNSTVFSVAVSGATVYLGGGFTRLCADAPCVTPQAANGANRIVSWNGSSYSPLGSGVNGLVYSLAFVGSTLYLGGTFDRLCNTADCSVLQAANGTNRIASWNGSAFAALGNGVNATVQSLAVNSGTLFLGGGFTRLCSSADCSTFQAANGVNRLASWNGSAFAALGNGVNNVVAVTAPSGTSLVIGGDFTRICGDAACTAGALLPAGGTNRIAVWTGAAYTPIGNGVNNTVSALAISGSTIYLGGVFTRICGDAACTAGALLPAGGTNRLATWNGASYAPIGQGVQNGVSAIVVSGGRVYLGGDFPRVCGDAACTQGALQAIPGVRRIASTTGTSFSAVGPVFTNTPDGTVFSLAVSGDDVYVGGGFRQAGPVPANAVARYNRRTNSWTALGFGLLGNVYALAVAGNTLYLGGDFRVLCADANCGSTVAPNGFNRLASWNGSTFSPLGNGVNGEVYALAASGSTVYIGGQFSRLCGDAACTNGALLPANGVNNIASWNGASFGALGNGVNGAVYALATSGSNVYLGGNFNERCNLADCSASTPTGINRIAQWNGAAFLPLGNGVNSQVYALAMSGTTVYLGGDFNRLCGDVACTLGALLPATGTNRIASWNGTTFSPLGNGVNSLVSTLAVSGSTVYLGGEFTRLCGDVTCTPAALLPATGMNLLASWNGTAYASLGNGANASVYRIAVADGDVFVGGYFSVTGSIVSSYFGRYGESADLAVTISASAVTVTAGNAISYTVTLTNTGPATAMSSTLAITLTANVTGAVVTPSQGSCAAGVCTIGYLAPGQVVTITVSGTASTFGPATIGVTAGTVQVDPVVANSQATATISVLPGPLVVPASPVQRDLTG